jgi:hypothetical protein
MKKSQEDYMKTQYDMFWKSLKKNIKYYHKTGKVFASKRHQTEHYRIIRRIRFCSGETRYDKLV